MNDDDDPDGHSNMDSSCTLCKKGAEELIGETDVKGFPHCNICNVCSLADCDFDSLDIRTICEELDCGLDTIKSVNKSVNKYGCFSWTCNNCIVKIKSFMKKDYDKNCEKNYSDDHSSMLARLNAETAEIRRTLDKVSAGLDYVTKPQSPPRKIARFQWNEDNIDPICSFPPQLSDDNFKLPAELDKLKPTTYSDKVKLNIKTNDNVLKALHSKRHLVTGMCTTKKKTDGSMNLLFKSFKEAQKAKQVLEENMENAVISNPSLDEVKRFNLVGLTFKMSKSEVVASIIEENSSWLNFIKLSEETVQIENDPLCVLTVRDVVKCRNNDIFRVYLTMSQSLFARLGSRKISVGFS